jgi:hypothetical protein
LRMCISAWLIPNALTWITAWPARGSGSMSAEPRGTSEQGTRQSPHSRCGNL